MGHQINKIRIKAVANALNALKEKVVFVGGATISLYSDRLMFEVRPTDDVDVIIEIVSYAERAELEERLRAVGFSNDIESGIICRYQINGIIVDIMPTDDPSVGFSTKWYPEGFTHAVDCVIDEACTVKVLPAPYFVATKLEAYKDRGCGDGRTSQDFEDIIFILENRKGIWEEMKNVEGELNDYLRIEFQNLLNNPEIREWIDCHVERGSPPATYLILEEMKKFIE